MQAAVLLDVYNFLDLAKGNQVVASLNDLIAKAVTPTIDYVEIRLYGGWYETGVLTNHASKLVADTVGVRFPMRHPSGAGLLRGKIGLADSPAALDGRQYASTLTNRRGIKRIVLLDNQEPNGCASPGLCSMQALKRLAKKPSSCCPVDRCSVTNRDAFRHKEQKMVDTMLAIDTLHFAVGNPRRRVLVASDDADLIPALDVASAMGGDVTLVARAVPNLHGLDHLFPTTLWTGYSRA